jgi:metallo-beta-lactamase family protein
MQITFQGASRQVTGSRYLLNAGGLNILVDCGMFQERDYVARNWAPFTPDPSLIDRVVLTHAHLDHCGLLPRLVAQGYKNPIITTEPSVALARLIMTDSARIQEEDAAYKIVRHQRENRTPPRPVVPLYKVPDAMAASGLLRGYPFHKPIKLNDQVTVTFYEAGHILGSGSALFEVTENNVTRKILFSGDLGQWDKPLINDPEKPAAADYIVMESTYGDKLHDKSKCIESQLADIINPVFDRGGTVIIPTFALERAQELVYHLGNMHRDKTIPATRTFVDSPMAADVTATFLEYSEYLDEDTMKLFHAGLAPLRFPGLRYVRAAADSKAINGVQGSKIIMSTSGMCEAGRIKHHLRQYISDPRNAIVFVGYQSPGTLGAVIKSGENPVRIHGAFYPVKAQIAEITGMSAHGDRDDLFKWLSLIQAPPRKIFLTHGEGRVCNALRQTISDKLGWTAVAPDIGHSEKLD